AEDFHAALWTDLRRNRTDADLTDVKYLATEADHALLHLRQWMKPLAVSTPVVLGPAHVQVQFDPLGGGLIIGTWNYPLMLPRSTPRRDQRRDCRRRQALGGGPGHRRRDRAAPAGVPEPGRLLRRPRREARDDRAAGTAVGPHLLHRRNGGRQGG